MTAYDTTEEDEDDEYIPAGAVILSDSGVDESDFERVMAAGLARLRFQAAQEAMIDVTGNGVDVKHDPETNIVKVEFGKKQ